MREEGFAARWSRRKRGVAEVVPAPEPPMEEPPLLDSLPLDEIGPWLKRRVPEAWKTAALRRIWVADPAIRGFVGLADYAWDWNTPGGAPFYGPMQAIDDVADLLSRAMGSQPKGPEALPEPEQPAMLAGPLDLPPTPAVLPAPAPESAPPPRRRGGRAAPA
jgi:hypothetical protein